MKDEKADSLCSVKDDCADEHNIAPNDTVGSPTDNSISNEDDFSPAPLTSWQRVLIARHQDRPHAMDYVNELFEEFIELHGDRCFGDDQAMLCGFAKIDGQKVVVIAQQKGKDTRDNITRNWGMSHPEGYRKALRVIQLAEKYRMPVVVFIDTPGAFPGIGAEERGQAEAIAHNIRALFMVRIPIICIIIGEGASGGALGVGVGDAVMMLKNSWYCVISPEGCAAILWKDRAHAEIASQTLKLTPEDLLELNVIDGIIEESNSKNDFDKEVMFCNVKKVIIDKLAELSILSVDELLEARYQRFRKLGKYIES